MIKYKVIEKFISIDGEGPSAGELAVFIRFSGCDLRCSWCDTSYSWDGTVEPKLMLAEEIYEFIKESEVSNVTLTGGEPLIQKGIEELLVFLLKKAEEHPFIIRIETHGGVDIEPLATKFSEYRTSRFNWFLQFIVDFKLPESKMLGQMCFKNLETVGRDDCVKFVIASLEDLEIAAEMAVKNNLDLETNVYFSPVVDLIEPKVVVEKMIEKKLSEVKLQLQLHKYIWPKDMRGV